MASTSKKSEGRRQAEAEAITEAIKAWRSASSGNRTSEKVGFLRLRPAKAISGNWSDAIKRGWRRRAIYPGVGWKYHSERQTCEHSGQAIGRACIQKREAKAAKHVEGFSELVKGIYQWQR